MSETPWWHKPPEYDAHPNTFAVLCCERRRGVLPGGIFVCSRCDYDHDHATHLPNEGAIADMPARLADGDRWGPEGRPDLRP